MEYPDFDAVVTQWERLADGDGAEPKALGRRSVRMVQNPDLGWTLTARYGSVAGAQVNEIVDHYAAVERLADVEAARAEYGERFHDHLARTDVCIDHRSFETVLAMLAGAQALIGHVRLVVYDGAGTVIDLGRRRRLFTGSAREAALLAALRCRWLGCWVDVSVCEIDHLEPASNGGPTDQDNSAAMCGRHNRLKHHGYQTCRDPDGTWRTIRPDGTEIPDHILHDPYGIHTPDTG